MRLTVLLVILPFLIKAQNQINRNWPKHIRLEQQVITIYQPEVDRIEGNQLEARAAFNIYDGTRLPVFGAMWLKARMHIDKSSRTVTYSDIQVTGINFPDADAAAKKDFAELITTVAPTWQLHSSMADFKQAAAALKAESISELNNEPPNIFYEDSPTELIFIDGEPILAGLPGSELYQYVLNTPHFIVYSKSDRHYYLKAGLWWYRASALYDEWQPLEAPPRNIAELELQFRAFNITEKQEVITNSSQRPKLYVVTYPAALIETRGQPEWIPLPRTGLLYAENTDNDLLHDTHTDRYYVRFSGRWYRSTTLVRGKWTFVPPDSLPDFFRLIPADSRIGHVRLSVPGTPEALQAALDNFIPQTAIVDRKLAEMTADYDGDPAFEPIPGTNLQYAVNSPTSVLKTADNQYYAVDEAIWFASDSPEGPWQVATAVPGEVQLIPPSSPVFNIKFVYIYEYDENYVYTGYTGGYLGAYLYQGCVFYGTGYRYKPWYKSKYIPRPVTYAFGVNRTGGSNNRVRIGVGVSYGYPGYYDPYGYYGGYGYGLYNYAYADGNYTYKKGYETQPLDQVNIYNNRARGIVATANPGANLPVTLTPKAPAGNGWDTPGNLYTDKAGNIYRQDQHGGWYLRQDGVWVQIKGRPGN